MKKMCILISLCVLLVTCLPASLAESGSIDYFSFFVTAMQNQYDVVYQLVRDDLTEEERFAGQLLFDGIAMMSESSLEMQELLQNLTPGSAEAVKALINQGFIDVDHPGCAPMEDVLARLADVFSEKGLVMPELYYIQHFDVGWYRQEEGWQCFLGHMEQGEDRYHAVIDYEIYLSGEGMTVEAFTEGMAE